MAGEFIRSQALPQSAPPAAEADWLAVADLEKSQAEHLLDWLENNGFEECAVSASANGRLAVSYRPCPDAAP